VFVRVALSRWDFSTSELSPYGQEKLSMPDGHTVTILEFWEEEKPLRDEPTIKRGSFSSEDELRFKRSRLGGSGQFKTGHLGSPLSRGVILTTPKVLARDNVDE
jgi:hypothetical protein